MDFHNSLSDLDIFRKMTVCKTGFIFTQKHQLILNEWIVASLANLSVVFWVMYGWLIFNLK